MIGISMGERVNYLREKIRAAIYYGFDDRRYNMVKTTLYALSTHYQIRVHPQVYHSFLGYSGRAFEGKDGILIASLSFLGIYLVENGVSNCKTSHYGDQFENLFEGYFAHRPFKVADREDQVAAILEALDLFDRFIDHVIAVTEGEEKIIKREYE